jgi:hypothetical protein
MGPNKMTILSKLLGSKLTIEDELWDRWNHHLDRNAYDRLYEIQRNKEVEFDSLVKEVFPVCVEAVGRGLKSYLRDGL